MSYVAGRYYSNNITTSGSGNDLFDTIKTDLSLDRVTARKLTFVTSSGSVSVDVNNTGFWSPLWGDANGNYGLNFDEDNIMVNSLKIREDARICFIAIIY